jgi:hypothetical protein
VKVYKTLFTKKMAFRTGMPSFLLPGLSGCLCVMLLLAGCGRQRGDKVRHTDKETPGFEAVDDSDDLADWLTYQGEGWSIRYPSLFSLDTTGYLGSSLILYSALTDDGDQYSDNISVSVVDLAGIAADLDGYVKRCEQFITQYTEDPEILLSDRRRLHGHSYHELVYSEKQPSFRLIRVQHIRVRDCKVYVVTLTCEDAVYDLCKDTGETILKSFSILE